MDKTDLTMEKPDYATLLGCAPEEIAKSFARVCNPISIGKALAAQSIQNFWAKSASASLVMERIAAAGKTPDDFAQTTLHSILYQFKGKQIHRLEELA